MSGKDPTTRVGHNDVKSKKVKPAFIRINSAEFSAS